jgi:hypothetical protein
MLDGVREARFTHVAPVAHGERFTHPVTAFG